METKKLVFIILLVVIVGIALIYFSSKKDENLPEIAKLYEVVKIGDYVEYDCGKWNTNMPIPVGQGIFGGYNKNKSKSSSITPYLEYENIDDGWIVLEVKDNVVTLIHAGTPVAYFHKYGNSENSINMMNNFLEEEFYNKLYASSIRVLNYDDINNIIENKDIDANIISKIVKTGSWYWLGTAYNNSLIWSVNNLGIMDYRLADGSFGVRPVVELWNNVYYTSGDGTKDNPYIINR
ncbi:MAG: hypothetical protein PHH22_00865 [Clostridia bacterium]|nr:hypothetical protein [Clostridia bacterium]